MSEIETHVSYDHGEGVYRIWSNWGPHIRKFRANKNTRVVDDEESFTTFVVDKEHFDIGKAFRYKRALTDDQRADLSARMKAIAAAKKGVDDG